ncbi:MAG: 2-C-methyl-D-erythritol 2,4-cyclodiphosphate synthase [Actinobacteria bacterium]|nr:MAG: 2-C-methyl-D-erythritol 2,4-cyclodiphosphate synthase [Actinomycetota bacterium]
MRVGIGYDAHPFVKGRPLVLGGVNIDFEKGLAGHSDADVLVHAIIDALLGASVLGNIGHFFPSTDEYKDVSSLKLLEKTAQMISRAGYKIVNIDSVIILELPRLENHWQDMKKAIGNVLSLDESLISIKAKTTEKMGFTGRGEGIAAMATVLLDEG